MSILNDAAKDVASAAEPLEDQALEDVDKNTAAIIAALDRFTDAIESLPDRLAQALKRTITIT